MQSLRLGHEDNLKRHANVDQTAWMQESEKVINEFAARLPDAEEKEEQVGKFKNFSEAYEFLAKKRQEIAQKLGHRPGITEEYGKFRDQPEGGKVLSGEGFYKDISHPYSVWKTMTAPVYKLVDELILAAEQHLDEKDQKETIYTQANGEFYTYQKKTTVSPAYLPKKEIEYTRHLIKLKLPCGYIQEKDQAITENIVVQIIKQNYREPTEAKKKQEQMSFPFYQEDNVTIYYAHIDSKKREEYFAFLDPYFKNLLKPASTSSMDTIENFLKEAGKLFLPLGRMLPTLKGSAAIAEWMIRGIAYKKGIYLGEYEKTDLTWDFKALFPLKMEEYCDWFAKNIFANNRLLTKEEAKKPFAFGSTPIKAQQDSPHAVLFSSQRRAEREPTRRPYGSQPKGTKKGGEDRPTVLKFS